MSDNNYQEIIKNNKLFDGIPAQNLEFPFYNEKVIKMKEGEIVFQKGDQSKYTYLVLAGRVKIKIYIENKSIKLNKTEKDFFGEIEVLEDTYRRSAAVANTDCILYLLSKSDFRTLITENPGLNDNIIAYNKVEIPELEITIHPDLLKKDTDKFNIIHPGKKDSKPVKDSEPETVDEEIIDDSSELETTPEIQESVDLPDKELEEIPDNNDNSPQDNTPATTTEPDNVSEQTEIEDEFNILTEEKAEEPEAEISLQDEVAEIEEIDIEIPEDEFAQNETDDNEIQFDSEYTEPEIIQEDDSYSEPDVAVPAPEYSDIPEEKNTEEERNWFSSTGEISESGQLEEEKEKYEAEEEKLKYDDTILNVEKILDAVHKINSASDDKDLIYKIINETVKLTEAQAGVLYLVDNKRQLLIKESETEEGYVETSYSLDSGLTGLAAETGEIINIREPQKDFRYSEEVDSIRGIVGSSLLCVPLINGEKETIAVICLTNSSAGKFQISDEEKMLSLAPHIAQSLQNFTVYKHSTGSSKHEHLPVLTRFITDNIQTPVLTMKYYAAQIKKKNISADVKTVLNVLMDQADSIVNFLHSTLALTENKNRLQIEEYDLQEVMDNSLSLLAEYVESRNVTLYKKVESSIKIKVDKKAFYQACLQIAKNACDAMGENGNIYITAKRTGDLVNIEFRDTGPGISDEIKQQIFAPFKTFNRESGTGLGLAVAQKIIRDHGGELTVESVTNEGATFIISLPFFEQ